MMIRLPPQYSHSPIDLLGKKQPRHLMRERHPAHRQLRICTSVDLFRESVRTSDKVHQALESAYSSPLD